MKLSHQAYKNVCAAVSFVYIEINMESNGITISPDAIIVIKMQDRAKGERKRTAAYE